MNWIVYSVLTLAVGICAAVIFESRHQGRLGARGEGQIEYGQVIRTAGYSCPSVITSSAEGGAVSAQCDNGSVYRFISVADGRGYLVGRSQ